jgi:hypothetical protein
MGHDWDVKQKGYRNHERVADLLDRPQHQSGYRPRPDQVIALVADEDYHRDGIVQGLEMTLVSTTNAGFRGIEASVRHPDGTVVYMVPLGIFTVRPHQPVEIAYRTDRASRLRRRTFKDQATAERWIDTHQPDEVRWATN